MVETTSTDSTAYRSLYTTAISRGHPTHNSDCPNCGGALKIIARPEPSSKDRPFDTLRAGIEDPPVLVKILSHLGLLTRAPAACPGASSRFIPND